MDATPVTNVPPAPEPSRESAQPDSAALAGALLPHLLPALAGLVGEELERRAARLGEDLRRREEDLAGERGRQALASAVAQVPFFDPEDAIRELAPRVVVQDGHCLCRPASAPGAPDGARPVPLAAAVQDLARRKPHWVRAALAGGTGAGEAAGSAGPPAPARVLTYADLLKGVDFARSGQVRLEL